MTDTHLCWLCLRSKQLHHLKEDIPFVFSNSRKVVSALNFKNPQPLTHLLFCKFFTDGGNPLKLVCVRQLPVDKDEIHQTTENASNKRSHQWYPEPVVVTPAEQRAAGHHG